MVNPLVPTPFDILVSAFAVVVWVYTAVAFVSAIRNRHVTGGRFLVWFLVIVFIPIAGATAWFVLGRDPKGNRSDPEAYAPKVKT
ncbi:PLDc N-terminal domain-containing protein [Microbacterium sp. PMB16]|uniref:PLDc N-terminal domain-containing protein n=1 Tax=Microbacterium sp. PMB16 TaxID=3120157 RepID=UPI003F4BAB0B